MTLKQTRQLGIEFERRVQTILPATENVAKLDTETIYSFLNQYQQKYIHDIYRGLDKIESGTRLSAHVERILQSMLKSQILTEVSDENYNIVYDNTPISDSARSKTYKAPIDYQMYVRSVSNVSRTFSWIGSKDSVDVLPNIFTSQTEVWKLMETPHNKLRILRYPVAILSPYEITDDAPPTPPKRSDYDNDSAYEDAVDAYEEAVKDYNDLNKKPSLTVIHDRYTDIEGVKLLYYKEPIYFDIMTSTPCELPMDCFDDLVTGAVELYIGYVRGGIRQQEEDGRRDRFNRRQAERENENQNNEQQ